MWSKLDDGFFDHPKARAVGKDGRALFLSGLCWSSGHLNDGFIATTDLPLVAAKAEVRASSTVRRLVDANLWEAAPGGWWIHDFGDWNPSSNKVAEMRLKRAEAGRKGGLNGSKSQANETANS